MELKDKLPNLYKNIDETLESAKLILSEAVPNTQTLFHTPVVSTIHENKIVSRVMVLREFNFDNKILRFHTDNRAAKIDDIMKNASSTVIGYDPDLKIQIKMQGQTKVHIDDEVAKMAWNESTPRSKKCYSVKGGSTKEIEDPQDYDIQDFESFEEGDSDGCHYDASIDPTTISFYFGDEKIEFNLIDENLYKFKDTKYSKDDIIDLVKYFNK